MIPKPFNLCEILPISAAEVWSKLQDMLLWHFNTRTNVTAYLDDPDLEQSTVGSISEN